MIRAQGSALVMPFCFLYLATLITATFLERTESSSAAGNESNVGSSICDSHPLYQSTQQKSADRTLDQLRREP